MKKEKLYKIGDIVNIKEGSENSKYFEKGKTNLIIDSKCDKYGSYDYKVLYSDRSKYYGVMEEELYQTNIIDNYEIY